MSASRPARPCRSVPAMKRPYEPNENDPSWGFSFGGSVGFTTSFAPRGGAGVCVGLASAGGSAGGGSAGGGSAGGSAGGSGGLGSPSGAGGGSGCAHAGGAAATRQAIVA